MTPDPAPSPRPAALVLSDAECNRFRALPLHFNGMVQAIYEAGHAAAIPVDHVLIPRAELEEAADAITTLDDGLAHELGGATAYDDLANRLRQRSRG